MQPVVDIYSPRDMRHHCPRVSDAEFVDSTSGSLTAQITIHDPVTVSVLTEDCPVTISDPRSGEVLWTGRVARDGLEVSPMGESATVRCVGDLDALYSSYWSLPYIVNGYSEWSSETIKYASNTNWSVQNTSRPVSPPWDCVLLGIDEGKTCYPSHQARAAYEGHLGSDMYIGGVTFNVDSGTARRPDEDASSASYLRNELIIGDQFWNKKPMNRSWQTTALTLAYRASSTDWPAPPTPHDAPPRNSLDNYLVLRSYFEGPAGVKVARDNVWTAFSRIVVMGQRVSRYGNNRYVAAERAEMTHVVASDIVEDVIGRCLRGIVDPTLTSIATTTWGLSQADYRNPSSPGEILDDMVVIHPDHLWRVGPTRSSGLHDFEWRLWSSTPRYVADLDAELDMDGAPDPLHNRVTIRWEDWRGRPRSKSFNASPTAYPDTEHLSGVSEPEPLDLDESLGEGAIVNRIGQMWLDQVARRALAGAVTVRKPVLDLHTQQLVTPGEIQAGETLVLASDPDQVVHRIVEVTHRGVDEATMSIGRPRLTLDQIVSTRGRKRR